MIVAPICVVGIFMTDTGNERFMRQALQLAARGAGKTSPNPMVGAVIVKAGRVLAEGYHSRPGGDHAEIVALKKAGKRARGATIYVTLEPCCHTGNTGPCTAALIKAGVNGVCYATRDPNPEVNGKGARQLRKAGIKVETGLLRSEAQRLNEIYFGYYRHQRPYIILKLAQSLDGRIATATGDSRWITSKKSRILAHRLRSEVDAVVVGAGTVRADNPALTVRHTKGKNPYRVIISGSLDIPRACRLLTDNQDLKTILASSEKSIRKQMLESRDDQLIYWSVRSTQKSELDLADLVRKADAFGLRSLLVEGGRTLATSFLKAGLVDKVCVVVAPLLIGQGITSLGDLGIREIKRALTFDHGSFEPCGTDVLFSGYLKKGK